MESGSIYCLMDPRTERVRYVGATSVGERRTRLFKWPKKNDRSPLGVWLREATKGRPILASDGRRFETIHEAGRATGLTFQRVWQVANGYRKTAKGLSFRYEE